MESSLEIIGRASWTPPRADEPRSSPELPFLPTLFRRRLGQLDRMALFVGHGALGGRGAERARLVLATRRGEIGHQYRISAELAEAGEVSPAAFSLSVFNAPTSLVSIAKGAKGAASAVHAGAHSLSAGLYCCAAMLASSPEPVLLIAADEYLPDVYAELEGPCGPAIAVGLLLGRLVGSDPDSEGLILGFGAGTAPDEAQASEILSFLDWLRGGSDPLRIGGDEWPISLSRSGEAGSAV